jgi:hypothetical protein
LRFTEIGIQVVSPAKAKEAPMIDNERKRNIRSLGILSLGILIREKRVQVHCNGFSAMKSQRWNDSNYLR